MLEEKTPVILPEPPLAVLLRIEQLLVRILEHQAIAEAAGAGDHGTADQMATMIGVSRRTFYGMVNTGAMPPACFRHGKVVRWSRTAVLAAAAATTSPGLRLSAAVQQQREATKQRLGAMHKPNDRRSA